MIKKLIKRVARRVLKAELDSTDRLIERLRNYARPHIPELIDDGSDQSYNLQFQLDVNNKVYIPQGIYNLNTKVSFEASAIIEGEIE